MNKKSYAVVFPGQGSQSVGMLSELAETHALIQQTFAEASDTLGYDLWSLAQQGPEEKIRQTEFTQPLMYVSGVALWRLWASLIEAKKIGAPAIVAGHSLGEFTALTASRALSFNDGIALVNRRAALMAAAVEEGQGGMGAILGMDDDKVIDLCQSLTGERLVEAVNFNGPGQVAISGHIDAVQQVLALSLEQGAKKAVLLPVSVPNHSSLMREAGRQLADIIDATAFNLPEMPVMQNTHACIASDLGGMLAALKTHVFSPVLWTQSYRAMIDDYAPEVVIELGPGKVLAGIGKRIERSLKVFPVDTTDTLQKAVAALTEESDANE